MKKILFLQLILANLLPVSGEVLMPDSLLRRYAAQMLMAGFKGNSISNDCDAMRYVRDLHVGAIILFDVDLTRSGTIGSRNITRAGQLACLTSDLQSAATYPLIIALDQEGGRVARMKPQYGFKKTVSAQYLGDTDSEDTTRHYASQMAQEISMMGVNLNLAPVVDVKGECPALGKIQRCFSADPQAIARQAGWMIEEHHGYGVACTLKHFPGHGSATGDSHWNFVDVTRTWQPSELEPYKFLIQSGLTDVIMTAHIMNQNIDEQYPATLSHKTLQGLLRDSLHYDGVIVTDDIYMQAIVDNYSVEQAVVLAINAGADMLCVGNNISTGFEVERPFRLVDIIVQAVKDGRISQNRILEAHRRIDQLCGKIFSKKWPQVVAF